MIVHVFNSSKVGGPESLVLPALRHLGMPAAAVFLLESRCGERGRRGFEYSRSLGIDTVEVEVRSRLDLNAIQDLATVLRRLGAQVIHAHDVKASVYSYLAKRTGGLRGALVSTHHGVHGRPDVKTKVYERLYSYLVLRAFDRVLAVSSSDCETLVKRGLGAERVKLHLNGLDARRIEPAARATVGRE